jgi:hypothetical protein
VIQGLLQGNRTKITMIKMIVKHHVIHHTKEMKKMKKMKEMKRMALLHPR